MRWRGLWAGGSGGPGRRLPGKRGVGMSLGGTLLAVAVIALLGSAMASLGITHMRLTSRQDLGLAATNVARSAVSNAISNIIREPDFGKTNDDQVRLQVGEAEGFLTFDTETDRQPYCTNNLEGEEDVAGYDGALVPAGTAHLVAVGRCGGAERRVEAVLRLPPFPWAIASAGTIRTDNGVLVASLPQGVWPPPTDISKLLPADLIANDNRSGAIFLGNGSTVLGDVETPGDVKLENEDLVSVRGEIRSRSTPVKLPKLDPLDYDPDKPVPPLQHFDLGADRPAAISGTAKVVAEPGQEVKFLDGLTVVGGILFVQGDLHLYHGLSGNGMVVATGNITIEGAAQLDGLTEVAVISGGTVRLKGQGAASSRIKGVFYAEKGLEARQLTLIGSLLTGQASTGVSLSQVNMYYSPPGQIETVTPGGISNGGLAVSVTPVLGTVVTFVNPLANDSDFDPNSSAFYVDLQPDNGDFPVTISVTSGGFNMPPRVVADAAEIEDYLSELSDAIDADPAFDFPPSQTIMAGQNLYWQPSIDEAKPIIEAAIRKSMGGTQSTTVPGTPTSTLFANISQFLPLYDRVRVVSWIER